MFYISGYTNWEYRQFYFFLFNLDIFYYFLLLYFSLARTSSILLKGSDKYSLI